MLVLAQHPNLTRAHFGADVITDSYSLLKGNSSICPGKIEFGGNDLNISAKRMKKTARADKPDRSP